MSVWGEIERKKHGCAEKLRRAGKNVGGLGRRVWAVRGVCAPLVFGEGGEECGYMKGNVCAFNSRCGGWQPLPVAERGGRRDSGIEAS